jgi:hypothetical protein
LRPSLAPNRSGVRELEREVGAGGFRKGSRLWPLLASRSLLRPVAGEREARSGAFAGRPGGAARRTVRLALDAVAVRADPPVEREAGSFFLVSRGRLVGDIQCPSSLSPPPSKDVDPNRRPRPGAS